MLFKSVVTAIFFLAILGCTHKKTASEKPVLTVLQGARIIDGTGQVLENSNLLIRQNHIEAIQPANQPLPPDARIVDLTGKTVMPALIAAHAHLGITENDQAGAAHINQPNVMRQLKKYMNYGVGTVMSLGTDHEFIYDLREQRQKNQIQTPTILTAGRGFGVPMGAPPAEMGMDQVYRPTSIDEVKTDMKQLAERHPDLVKIWVDDFGHTMKKKMDPKLYQAVITEAHKNGLKVAAHVYYLADAKQLAADGVDIFAHSVRDQKVDAAFIALLKKNNISYIPTLALDDAFFVYAENPAWMQDDFFKKALDPGVWEWLHSPANKTKLSSKKDLAIAKANALTLLKAGVAVGLGTDSGATLARIQGFAEHRELELLVSAGFTPMQALQAATGVNANILGIAKQRGIIAAGEKADLLVLNANPLDDILNTRKINAVWIEGNQATIGNDGPKSGERPDIPMAQ